MERTYARRRGIARRAKHAEAERERDEPERLARDPGPRVEVVERRLEELDRVREREGGRDPGGRADRDLREDPEQDQRHRHEQGDERGGTRITREDAEQDAERPERRRGEREPDEERRHAEPGGERVVEPAIASTVASTAVSSVPTATPTTMTSAIFSATSSPSRTRPRANLASTFSSFSDAIAPGGDDDAEERHGQRERVGLHLRREEPGAPSLVVELQRDRVRRRAQGLAGLVEREVRLVEERLELRDVLLGRGIVGAVAHLRQQPLGSGEADDVEVVPEEVARAALLDQADVVEVRLDVRLLQLPVQVEDERLGLSLDAPRQAAPAGAEDRPPAARPGLASLVGTRRGRRSWPRCRRCAARRRPPPRTWARGRPRSRRGRSPRSRRSSGRRRSTSAGMPSRSTKPTRGRSAAKCATRPTSSATRSG